ncbi:MAG TPA: diaminopimelate epimerase [Chlamydiales bacterium]|nr:diaminopimelate epimerase [Chlamydiales bacterium]
MNTFFNSPLPFSKYQAAGNDFILIDGRFFPASIDFTSYFQKLCHRKFGIGADGVIIVALDPEVDFAMRIFNSDGKEAEGCGNGLCIVLQFLNELQFPDRAYRIRMGNRILQGRRDGALSIVELGASEEMKLTFDGELHFVHTGAPHLVQFVDDIENFPLEERGKEAIQHPSLTCGANLNIAALQGDGSIKVRTFERGVNEETFACGTGAAAVAVIASSLFGVKMPLTLQFRGGNLRVWQENGILVLANWGVKLFSGWVDIGKT